MDASIIRKILRDYFEGRITLAERQILLEWLKDPSNREVFFDALHERERSNPQMLSDVQEDWDNLRARLYASFETKKDSDIQQQSTLKRTSIFANWLVAASIIMLFTLGWWQRDLILYKTYSSGFGETKSFELPDGSWVILNADSKLMYPRFYILLDSREVRLNGEAQFSVIHTRDNRPFLVRTPDHLEVRVLGTEFLVYSRKEESKVVLTKGKVQLRSLKTNDPVINIHPGDVATIDKQGSIQLKEDQNVTDHLAWKEHSFVFNRTKLKDIAQQIQERFGVRIEIPDTTLAGTRLSGKYPAENADEVIFMITRLLNLKSEKRGNNTIRLTD